MLKIENKKISLLAALAVVCITVYLALKYLLPLFIPFVIAYIIAHLINPIAAWLTEKLKVKKGIVTAVILFLLIIIIGYIGVMIVNKLFVQLRAVFSEWSYYEQIVSGKLESICSGIEQKMGLDNGCVLSLVKDNINNLFEKGREDIMPVLMDTSLPALFGLIDIFIIVVIVCIAAFFITKDMEKINLIRKNFLFSRELGLITSKLSCVGNAYLKAQIVIMFITSVLCFLGLKILGNPYAMLVGIILGLLDALPLIGIGIVLIPWSILYMVSGNYLNAGIIFITFVICYLVRELLEPKLIGKQAGIHPLISIISIYTGYKLFGILGVLLGPVGYVIISQIMGQIYHTIYKQ